MLRFFYLVNFKISKFQNFNFRYKFIVPLSDYNFLFFLSFHIIWNLRIFLASNPSVVSFFDYFSKYWVYLFWKKLSRNFGIHAYKLRNTSNKSTSFQLILNWCSTSFVIYYILVFYLLQLLFNIKFIIKSFLLFIFSISYTIGIWCLY